MRKLTNILDFRLLNIAGYELHVINLLWLIIILVISWFVLFSFNKILNRLVASERLAERNRQSFWILFKYFVYVLAFTFAFQALGINLTPIIAGSAALLVGLGLGLQQIFSDIVSGIFLLVEGSVKIGDIMEVDSLVGKVTEINLRTSELLSRDGITIIVPNHKFITENVVNWSHIEVLTRFKITVGVAYGTDPEIVREILMECAQEHKAVSNAKANKAIVRLINFGESSVDFQLLFWSKNVFRIEDTQSELRFMIVQKFSEKGVQIPFPQRDLHIKSGKL